jgi:5-methylcytosine-specific restriction endonuclease McrA
MRTSWPRHRAGESGESWSFWPGASRGRTYPPWSGSCPRRSCRPRRLRCRSARRRPGSYASHRLLRHAVPDGDMAEIVDRALTLLVEQAAKAKYATTPKPRSRGATPASSRHIPAEVRRTVWLREGGRCAFVGTRGRCEARGFLEFHHVTPYGVGGVATAENIQLRCGPHNRHEADLYYGRREAGEGVVREGCPPWPAIGSRARAGTSWTPVCRPGGSG